MSVDVRCARERSPSRRSTFFKAPRECGLILEEEEVKEEVEEETKEEKRGYGTIPKTSISTKLLVDCTATSHLIYWYYLVTQRPKSQLPPQKK